LGRFLVYIKIKKEIIMEILYRDQLKIEDVKVWCEENNAHYYARPSSCYSEKEAIKETIKLGKERVLIEEIF